MASLFKDDPEEWVRTKLEKASDMEKLLFSIRRDLINVREAETAQRLETLRKIKSHHEVKSYKTAKSILRSIAIFWIIVLGYWYFEADFFNNVFLFILLLGSQIGFVLTCVFFLGLQNRLVEIDTEMEMLERLQTSSEKNTSAHILSGVFSDLS